jgi:hypothetical protein
VIGGHSLLVSFSPHTCDDFSSVLTTTIAMKVHHEGFLDSQAANLAGKTGLPYVDSAVGMSDMANGGESLVGQNTA